MIYITITMSTPIQLEKDFKSEVESIDRNIKIITKEGGRRAVPMGVEFVKEFIISITGPLTVLGAQKLMEYLSKRGDKFRIEPSERQKFADAFLLYTLGVKDVELQHRHDEDKYSEFSYISTNGNKYNLKINWVDGKVDYTVVRK